MEGKAGGRAILTSIASPSEDSPSEESSFKMATAGRAGGRAGREGSLGKAGTTHDSSGSLPESESLRTNAINSIMIKLQKKKNNKPHY